MEAPADMKTLPISAAREQLRELIEEASGSFGRIVITRNGKPEAVLIGHAEYESWLETLEVLEDAREVAAVRQGLGELARGHTESFEKVFGESLPERGERLAKAERHNELSVLQRAILQHAAQGLSRREIASLLNLTVLEVASHFTAIFEKLDVHSASGARKHARAQKRRVIKKRR
jgi:prevent-host-death family protein